MSNIILTGDRPTGKLHIGHYVGSLKRRVELQNKGDYEKMYILIADAQALTDNSGTPQKVRDNIITVMLDYLSIGLDPDKVSFVIQSEVRALPEITAYYMNLVTLPRLLRNPTVKSEISLRGYDSESKGIPVGFANYPISQAADITGFDANIVPVGDDQLPMVEQTREIVKSFNSTYNVDALVMPNPVLPENEACYRLPGLDGNDKSDSNTVKEKVFSMYTDPNHIKVEDPGKIEGNMVFTYLDAFCSNDDFEKYYPEFNNLDELKKAYSNGGIGDMRIKKFLYEILEEFLTPIREKRKEYTSKIPEIISILKKGTDEANKKADEVLNRIKKAMGICYFNDEFIKEQTDKFDN